MKIKVDTLRKIIRQELKEGFSDDVKKFQDQYKNYNDKLAGQAGKLRDRQTQMKAVKLINKKIGSLVGELKKLHGRKVLETVKKSHANKYEKSITIPFLIRFCEVSISSSLAVIYLISIFTLFKGLSYG